MVMTTIVAVVLMLITMSAMSVDTIGDTMDIDGKVAFLTPRGWEIVNSYDVREYSIEEYKKAGVYGKAIDDLSDIELERFARN